MKNYVIIFSVVGLVFVFLGIVVLSYPIEEVMTDSLVKGTDYVVNLNDGAGVKGQ